MMAPTVFGGRKLRGGRDPHEEQAALHWIYSILREPVPAVPFDDLLKDGQILCRFMQRIEPGLIRRINSGGGPIKLMENLGIFTDACRTLGVSQCDLFQSIDLFEKRDIGAVYNCLSQLGGILQKIRPDLPAYGPKIAEENKRHFSEQQQRAGNGVVQTGMNKGSGNFQSGTNKAVGNGAINLQQSGPNKGATTQKGMNFANTRH